jgi:hypothetical protein
MNTELQDPNLAPAPPPKKNTVVFYLLQKKIGLKGLCHEMDIYFEELTKLNQSFLYVGYGFQNF